MNNPQLSRKEETLSDKRTTDKQVMHTLEFYWYSEDDVKDFIKKLKDDFDFEYGKEASKRMKGIISERMGERLI
jgi:hypothetical protein